MKNHEKVILALATGLVTGTVLGVLLAPHKGSKIRRLIKDQGNKVVDDLCEKFDEGKQGLNALAQEVIHAVKEAVCKQPTESESKPLS